MTIKINPVNSTFMKIQKLIIQYDKDKESMYTCGEAIRLMDKLNQDIHTVLGVNIYDN